MAARGERREQFAAYGRFVSASMKVSFRIIWGWVGTFLTLVAVLGVFAAVVVPPVLGAPLWVFVPVASAIVLLAFTIGTYRLFDGERGWREKAELDLRAWQERTTAAELKAHNATADRDAAISALAVQAQQAPPPRTVSNSVVSGGIVGMALGANMHVANSLISGAEFGMIPAEVLARIPEGLPGSPTWVAAHPLLGHAPNDPPAPDFPNSPDAAPSA